MHIFATLPGLTLMLQCIYVHVMDELQRKTSTEGSTIASVLVFIQNNHLDKGKHLL